MSREPEVDDTFGDPTTPVHWTAPARDDFDLGELHPRWISLRHRSVEHCTTDARAGWLTLRARGGSMDDLDATFVGRRQQHLSCHARTMVDPADGRGGLVVRVDDRHHYEIEVADGEARVLARIGPLRTTVAARPVPSGPVVLRVDVIDTQTLDGEHSGPDILTFGVEEPDGTFTPVAALDGKYLSAEVAGSPAGRVIGMYAAAGTVHFDWFDYEPVDGTPD